MEELRFTFLIATIFVVSNGARLHCADYMQCRHEVMEHHWRCTAKMRSRTEDVCDIAPHFRKLRSYSLRREAMFADCVSKRLRIEDYNAPTSEVCANNKLMPPIFGCWPSLNEELKRCQSIETCCSVASVCHSELHDRGWDSVLRERRRQVSKAAMSCIDDSSQSNDNSLDADNPMKRASDAAKEVLDLFVPFFETMHSHSRESEHRKMTLRKVVSDTSGRKAKISGDTARDHYLLEGNEVEEVPEDQITDRVFPKSRRAKGVTIGHLENPVKFERLVKVGHTDEAFVVEEDTGVKLRKSSSPRKRRNRKRKRGRKETEKTKMTHGAMPTITGQVAIEPAPISTEDLIERLQRERNLIDSSVNETLRTLTTTLSPPATTLSPLSFDPNVRTVVSSDAGSDPVKTFRRKTKRGKKKVIPGQPLTIGQLQPGPFSSNVPIQPWRQSLLAQLLPQPQPWRQPSPPSAPPRTVVSSDSNSPFVRLNPPRDAAIDIAIPFVQADQRLQENPTASSPRSNSLLLVRQNTGKHFVPDDTNILRTTTESVPEVTQASASEEVIYEDILAQEQKAISVAPVDNELNDEKTQQISTTSSPTEDDFDKLFDLRVDALVPYSANALPLPSQFNRSNHSQPNKVANSIEDDVLSWTKPRVLTDANVDGDVVHNEVTSFDDFPDKQKSSPQAFGGPIASFSTTTEAPLPLATPHSNSFDSSHFNPLPAVPPKPRKKHRKFRRPFDNTVKRSGTQPLPWIDNPNNRSPSRNLPIPQPATLVNDAPTSSIGQFRTVPLVPVGRVPPVPWWVQILSLRSGDPAGRRGFQPLAPMAPQRMLPRPPPSLPNPPARPDQLVEGNRPERVVPELRNDRNRATSTTATPIDLDDSFSEAIEGEVPKPIETTATQPEPEVTTTTEPSTELPASDEQTSTDELFDVPAPPQKFVPRPSKKSFSQFSKSRSIPDHEQDRAVDNVAPWRQQPAKYNLGDLFEVTPEPFVVYSSTTSEPADSTFETLVPQTLASTKFVSNVSPWAAYNSREDGIPLPKSTESQEPKKELSFISSADIIRPGLSKEVLIPPPDNNAKLPSVERSRETSTTTKSWRNSNHHSVIDYDYGDPLEVESTEPTTTTAKSLRRTNEAEEEAHIVPVDDENLQEISPWGPEADHLPVVPVAEIVKPRPAGEQSSSIEDTSTTRQTATARATTPRPTTTRRAHTTVRTTQRPTVATTLATTTTRSSTTTRRPSSTARATRTTEAMTNISPQTQTRTNFPSQTRTNASSSHFTAQKVLPAQVEKQTIDTKVRWPSQHVPHHKVVRPQLPPPQSSREEDELVLNRPALESVESSEIFDNSAESGGATDSSPEKNPEATFSNWLASSVEMMKKKKAPHRVDGQYHIDAPSRRVELTKPIAEPKKLEEKPSKPRTNMLSSSKIGPPTITSKSRGGAKEKIDERLLPFSEPQKVAAGSIPLDPLQNFVDEGSLEPSGEIEDIIIGDESDYVDITELRTGSHQQGSATTAKIAKPKERIDPKTNRRIIQFDRDEFAKATPAPMKSLKDSLKKEIAKLLNKSRVVTPPATKSTRTPVFPTLLPQEPPITVLAMKDDHVKHVDSVEEVQQIDDLQQHLIEENVNDIEKIVDELVPAESKIGMPQNGPRPTPSPRFTTASPSFDALWPLPIKRRSHHRKVHAVKTLRDEPTEIEWNETIIHKLQKPQEMSTCTLLPLCTSVQHAIELTCGSTLRSHKTLPKSKVGDCHRELEPLQEKIDDKSRLRNAMIERCMTGTEEKSDNMSAPRLAHMPSTLSCSMKLRVISSHCDILSKYCTTSARCGKTDEILLLSKEIDAMREELTAKTAECQSAEFFRFTNERNEQNERKRRKSTVVLTSK